MALSDNLSELATRAKAAEDRFAASKKEARDQLEQDVKVAREETQARAAQFHGDATATKDRAVGWADDLRRSWDEHLTQVRGRMEAGKSRLDAKMAEREAEDAEAYAYTAIEFAYTAVEEAEYACLNAMLARQNAVQVRVATQ